MSLRQGGCILQKTKVEISQGQSDDCQPISCEVPKMAVLWRRIPSDNIEQEREHGDEDAVESQEYLQVEDDAQDHGHDVAECLQNLQVEQGLNARDQYEGNQDDLGSDVPRSHIDLAVDAAEAESDVRHVDVVERLQEVPEARLVGLPSVVEHRVDQETALNDKAANRSVWEHSLIALFVCADMSRLPGFAHVHVVFLDGVHRHNIIFHDLVFVQERSLYVDEQVYAVDDVDDHADVVDLGSEHVPFEVDHVHDAVSLEDGVLVRLGYGVNDFSVLRGHVAELIELVLDFVHPLRVK